MNVQGVPKQADKSKVLNHIKKLHFLGCQFDQTDHKCWLFDTYYKDSWIFSYKRQYEEVFGNNAKSVKFSYRDCLDHNGTSGHLICLKIFTFSRYSPTTLNMASKWRKLSSLVKIRKMSIPKLWFSAFLPKNVSSSNLIFYWNIHKSWLKYSNSQILWSVWTSREPKKCQLWLCFSTLLLSSCFGTPCICQYLI